MKKRMTVALLAMMMAVMANAQEALKKVYDSNINPMTQIDEALAKAKAEDKFVIAQVGGNWCPWCLRFADYITKDDEIMQLINDNFVYIHVNYNPRRSANPEKAKLAKEMMARIGNPERFGFPVFVVLDADGKVVHTQDSGYLEEGQSYNKKKVLSFFRNWTPKAVNGAK